MPLPHCVCEITPVGDHICSRLLLPPPPQNLFFFPCQRLAAMCSAQSLRRDENRDPLCYKQCFLKIPHSRKSFSWQKSKKKIHSPEEWLVGQVVQLCCGWLSSRKAACCEQNKLVWLLTSCAVAHCSNLRKKIIIGLCWSVNASSEHAHLMAALRWCSSGNWVFFSVYDRGGVCVCVCVWTATVHK